MELIERLSGSRRWAVGAFAVVFLACLLCAYWETFSTFQAYDDEGAHLEATKAFLRGAPLYTGVYAYHGPFNFELLALLYRFSASAATSDAVRFIVAIGWTLTALAAGIAVARVTSSWPLGIAALIAWFFAAASLVNEPGHPVFSITLLLAAGTYVIARSLPAQPRRALIGLGLVAGALAMTKINVGALMIVGVVYAAALTLAPLAPMRRVAPFAVAALPVVLGASQLDTDSWRDWIIVVAAASLAIAAADDTPADADPERRERGALVAFGVAAVAMIALTIAILLVTGSALTDVLHDAFVRPSKHADIFNVPPQITDSVLPWSVLSVVAALLCRGGLRSAQISPRASGVGRIAAGLAIWVGLAQLPGFWFTGDTQELVLPTLLAWVPALPLRRRARLPWDRFMHVLVPSAAVMQSLHIYPVAGSQRGMAVLLYVLVGALCIRDGIAELEPATARVRDAIGLSAAAVMTVALLVPLLFTSSKTYAHGTALPFPGATRIHLDQPTVDTYVRLVRTLQVSCDAFVGEPGYYSLYGWSGIHPVDNLVMNEWMPILNADEQATVVKDLLARDRPCAIRNEEGIAFWQQDRPLKHGPLVRAIDAMKPIAKIGAFELRVPPARAASVSRDLSGIFPDALEARAKR